jgi:hypothetical protein
MTDLLARSSPPRDDEGVPGRRLTVVAALAGLAAPLLLVFLLWAVGLVAWFAADGGSHGSTLSVLRIAGDAWLLAHGTHLDLAGPVVVTASPLGLTLICALLAARLGRWAASLSAGGTLLDVGRATAAFTGSYAATGLVVALLCRDDLATPGLVTTAVGCLLVGGLAGGLGLLVGADAVAELRRQVPMPARSVMLTALGCVVLMAAAGTLLTALSLAFHGDIAARIADRLDLDATGAVFSLLLLLLVAPNVALLGASYLAGPGFAVGTGTVVSTAQVSVGPLPAVPIFAAVPADGAQPSWLAGLLVVPPALALVAALWAARVVPTRSWRAGTLRGLGGGAAGAVLLTFVTAWAGGSIGPGRMSQLGAPVWDLLVWNVLGLGLGGLLGGLASTWWARRRGVEEALGRPRPPRRPKPITLYPQRGPAPGGSSGDDLADEDTVVVRVPAHLRRHRPAGPPREGR